MDKLSFLIRREADISTRYGQLERLYDIADRVEALEAIAKRYEDAPVGSLTIEGDHWVFYNGGEAGSVNRVLDKTIRLVEVEP